MNSWRSKWHPRGCQASKFSSAPQRGPLLYALHVAGDGPSQALRLIRTFLYKSYTKHLHLPIAEFLFLDFIMLKAPQ